MIMDENMIEMLNLKSKDCEKIMAKYEPEEYRRLCAKRKYPNALRRMPLYDLPKDGDSQ